VATRNQQGWTSSHLNEMSELFLQHCRAHPGLRVIDIGAAYGIAARAALTAGAQVIANDLSEAHLQELAASVDPADRERLTLLSGRFPRDVRLEAGTLGAVHASNVLHFLTGPQLRNGIEKFWWWLAPGGRVFLHAGTPYQRPFAAFVPEYESRMAAGAEWPGWIENTRAVSEHRLLSQIPRALHLLDDVILGRELERAGFTIERIRLYRRHDLSSTMHLDGREGVGVIAVKLDDSEPH
jgi:SAM-dependent methyltransferase